MRKTKYSKVNKNEHEVLIQDVNIKKEKAFDFSSINDYKSIFSYNKPLSSLNKHSSFELNTQSKNLTGFEKFLNFTIIGVFYAFFIILLPFSLLICLKKVKENEQMVVYRLGRIKNPAYKPGYYILFPLIDSYHRLTNVQKEFCIPNLQILSLENAIVDVSTLIRYKITDPIKMTNSLQDLNGILKSMTRGLLFNIISKKDVDKIERDKNYLTQDFQTLLNEEVRKWGLDVLMVELTINSIVRDESQENEDPALKSLSLVFKSLFNSNSTTPTVVQNDSKPTTSSGQSTQGPDFISILQGMMPYFVPNSDGQQTLIKPEDIENLKNSSPGSEFEHIKLLKLIEPLITDNLVKEVDKVYEFHIKIKSTDAYKEDKIEIYYLDLKTNQKSRVGIGNCLFAKSDCIIKLNEEDLKDLLNDNLKPFTAYLSGRIEIDGDLQDVFKLKKLIKLVSNVAKINKI